MVFRALGLLLVLSACGGPGAGDTATDAGDTSDSARDAEPDATAMDAADAGPDAAPPEPHEGLPPTLSELGLRDPEGELIGGAILYDVAYPLWSDGADKRRFLRLPAGGAIDTTDPDAWRFPLGTEVFKEFRVEGRLIETRVFRKDTTGLWSFVSYVWRDDGSDADARPEGVPNALGTTHDVPDTAGCFDCHRGSLDRMLGLSLFQLDSVDAFVARGWLPTGSQRPDPPGDPSVSAALGYLHANCGGACHSSNHPLADFRPMRLGLMSGDARPEDTGFFRTAVGAEAQHTIGGSALIVVPGDPGASQLYIRMGLRDEEAMPPRGTEQVDPIGRNLVEALITSLSE